MAQKNGVCEHENRSRSDPIELTRSKCESKSLPIDLGVNTVSFANSIVTSVVKVANLFAGSARSNIIIIIIIIITRNTIFAVTREARVKGF